MEIEDGLNGEAHPHTRPSRLTQTIRGALTRVPRPPTRVAPWHGASMAEDRGTAGRTRVSECAIEDAADRACSGESARQDPEG